MVIVTLNVIPFPNPTICQISYYKTLSDLEEWQRTNRSLSVYPNPTQGSQLFIEFPGEGPITAHLSDMQGREVAQRRLPAASRQALDVSGLPGGMYLLQVAGQGFRAVEKVIVPR